MDGAALGTRSVSDSPGLAACRIRQRRYVLQ